MTVGLGGGGYVGIALESTMGTYVAPTVYVPILTENLVYTTTNYFSPQIKKTTMVGDAKLGYYHGEGPIEMEVDCQYLPYFMHCTRASVVKTGTGPYVYKYTPSSGASSGIGAGNATPKTMSLTVVRNARVFKYVGCVFPSYSFTIDGGILKATFNAMSLGETGVNSDTPPTPTFTAPALFGADAHQVFTDAAGLTPAFAAADVTFNGFTFEANMNGAAQNRIVNNRQATYISFGATEATITSQLDFLDRLEYEKFTALTKKAFKMTSTQGDGSIVSIVVYNAAYDTYTVPLGAMGDLVMADMTARVLSLAGAGSGATSDGYDVTVTSLAANIT